MKTIEECRKILGDSAKNMTDEQIIEVRDSLYKLAEISLDEYFSSKLVNH